MVYKNSNNTQSALVKLVVETVEEIYELDSRCCMRSKYIVLGNSNIHIFNPNKTWHGL